ncbi:chorismate mutase 2 isoform X1 [Vigna umbellata]|uniref:chorismate mutase 2 isoform X1 n=1 Tax=Vigna umbellata TaxID=87088 RepID=UPI001F5F9368|nr:chorismate mutase 2 isoform X1 [Vigna umbellata]
MWDPHVCLRLWQVPTWKEDGNTNTQLSSFPTTNVFSFLHYQFINPFHPLSSSLSFLFYIKYKPQKGSLIQLQFKFPQPHFISSTLIPRMAKAEENVYTLASVREDLIRQEDTIIYGLIERAKFPSNSHTYDEKYAQIPGFYGSLVEFVVKNTEDVQAKAGRYTNPEENPFFPENLPPSSVPSYPFSQFLHPGAASININKSVWKMYLRDLLPLLATSGDDGNYAQTAAADLSLLQAISRRIHYGKFVAEVKFRDAPQDYEPLIRAKDREGLMKLLTFTSVEETVRKRVEKKATVFGQEVSLDSDNDGNGKSKFDPTVASRLYKNWVIPLTKEVQVEYLLHRVD